MTVAIRRNLLTLLLGSELLKHRRSPPRPSGSLPRIEADSSSDAPSDRAIVAQLASRRPSNIIALCHTSRGWKFASAEKRAATAAPLPNKKGRRGALQLSERGRSDSSSTTGSGWSSRSSWRARSAAATRVVRPHRRLRVILACQLRECWRRCRCSRRWYAARQARRC